MKQFIFIITLLSSFLLHSSECHHSLVRATAEKYELQELNDEYLGEKDGNSALMNKLVGEKTRVVYLDEKQRAEYEVKAVDGRLYYIDGDYLVGKVDPNYPFSYDPWAIFVMDRNGRIYISFNQSVGRFQHSSLVAGEKVAAAGMIHIQDGVISSMTDRSGHYRPKKIHMQQFQERLVELGYSFD